MSHVILSPSRLSGEVTVPPSKSAAHRAILCAALSRGICHIHKDVYKRQIQGCFAMTINRVQFSLAFWTASLRISSPYFSAACREQTAAIDRLSCSATILAAAAVLEYSQIWNFPRLKKSEHWANP